MHIHYLINGLNGGGAAFPIPDLVACMKARGHSVRVLALMEQDGKSVARLEQAGIDWTLLGAGSNDWLKSARALNTLLVEDRPDLIWTSLTRATVYGQWLGRQHRIPVVSWQHNAFLKPANRRLLRWTRRLSDLWVADSQTVADFTSRELGVDAALIEQWPIFRARANVPQARPAAEGERLRIGSLGRLHANKCYRHLVAAAALLKAEHPALAARMDFIIGGSGEEHAALLEQVRAAGLDNVHFQGFVENTASFLASLHGYMQPSHHEGMCIAAHEAMQAGLPVIATPVGELQRSVLHGETGWLCAVGDVPAMTAALVALAGDTAAAAKMGVAGRERVLTRYGDAAFQQAGDRVLSRIEKFCATRAT